MAHAERSHQATKLEEISVGSVTLDDVGDAAGDAAAGRREPRLGVDERGGGAVRDGGAG